MSAKFTPGPWSLQGTTIYALNPNGTNQFSCAVQGGFSFQGGGQHFSRTPDDELAANAHLIVAAPDLLVALENAGQRLKHIREKFADWNNMTGAQRADFRNWIWHAECETEAAIAKATAP